ncbi:MAG: aldo/keto reductase [Aminivibrio sp.]
MTPFVRIGIGTAQFGMDYGISNEFGKTPEEEVSAILERASREGLRYIDTAYLYGDAEKTIGRILPSNSGFRIVTKLGVSTPGEVRKSERSIEALFEQSLGALRQKSVYALLAHNAADLLAPEGERVWSVFNRLKEESKVEKIGASVYNPEEAFDLLERYPIELVQIPLNLLDQRMIARGVLQEMSDRGIEIHSRSCFLQGLLLMDEATLDPFFEPVKEKLSAYRKLCKVLGLSPIEVALFFVLSVSEIDCVVLGFNSLNQFNEICEAVKKNITVDQLDFSAFAVDMPEIVEPRNWPRMGGEKSGSRT